MFGEKFVLVMVGFGVKLFFDDLLFRWLVGLILRKI